MGLWNQTILNPVETFTAALPNKPMSTKAKHHSYFLVPFVYNKIKLNCTTTIHLDWNKKKICDFVTARTKQFKQAPKYNKKILSTIHD